MQGTGNINYSFDKTKFNNYFTLNSLTFYPFYLIITILCFIFLMSLFYQKNPYKNGSLNNIQNNTLKHFFNAISMNSPLNIISMDNRNNGYIGLSQKSYVILICFYTISYFYLIQGILKNLIFSIIINIIQANPNNNPYNNTDCIIKNKTNPTKDIISNYTAILFLILFFMIPFLTPYILQMFNIDNYDLKHSYWLPWVILIVLLYPFILIIVRHSGNDKINILGKLDNYLDDKDHKYIEIIQSYFNSNYSSIFIFLFIIMVYTLLHIIYYTYNTKNQKIILIFIILVIFIFIPLVLILFGLNSMFGQIHFTGAENNISEIEKNGVSNLYQLIVKYNYPCFKK